MLDTTVDTRGTGTNDVAILQATWKGTPVRMLSSAREVEAWQDNWPTTNKAKVAKIIYDPAAGEVKVSGYSKGKFFKDFLWSRILRRRCGTSMRSFESRDSESGSARVLALSAPAHSWRQQVRGNRPR
jgi:hypothetical protein